MRSPSDIEEAAEAAARLRLSQRRRDISEGNRSWFRNAPEELAILVLLTVFVGSLVMSVSPLCALLECRSKSRLPETKAHAVLFDGLSIIGHRDAKLIRNIFCFSCVVFGRAV